jgi:diguanylate cyclase (GGDEF)-like protein
MGAPPSLRGRCDQGKGLLMTPTEGPGPSPNGGPPGQEAALERPLIDQTLADADQTLADTDQTQADADQARSDSDQASADQDQHASDLEQAAADREQAEPVNGVDRYAAARAERIKATDQRLLTAAARARTTAERLGAAHERDLTARARDQAAVERDHAAEALEASGNGAKLAAARRLAALRARGAHDRARAAEDRAAAARDRAAAAEDRARAAIELRHAYHDDLTGALRREMGEVALQNELDRARRGDGRLVLAFVDVDKLKLLNDRDGHVAGDALLRAVVRAMRGKMRSFDPVVRYGGDEFICALAGTDTVEATSRFAEIQAELARDHDDAGISVGVVELEPDETLNDLIVRGDAALYEAKGRARSGSVQAQ